GARSVVKFSTMGDCANDESGDSANDPYGCVISVARVGQKEADEPESHRLGNRSRCGAKLLHPEQRNLCWIAPRRCHRHSPDLQPKLSSHRRGITALYVGGKREK